MKSLNWGIIGPGSIANDFVSDFYWLAINQQVAAVLGRSRESTSKFAKRFSVPAVFYELEDFINHPGIDVVYIATPHPEHFKEALGCLEKRIPVLCEKPLTVSKEQCSKLLQASKDYSTFLMEGMWIRFLPSLQLVLRLIEENRIGNLVSVKASMGYKAPYDPKSRYFDPAAGGGSLLDLGVYPVFLASLLLGKPVAIKAISSRSPTGIDASCSMIMQYEKGRHANLESSLDSQSDSPAEITGDKGFIRIRHPWFEKSPGIEWHDYNGHTNTYPLHWEGHGLYFETAEVIECIGSGRTESALMPHALSQLVMDTMDRIREQIDLSYGKLEAAKT